jgi:6-phosphogluconolactonase/glucosamine-6-phosphate isomerase/deaminase
MKSSLEIFRQPDPESAAAEAGEQLNQSLTDNLKRPVLLMLSASSSLAILEYVGKTALGQNLAISILDERFSQDPSINNFAQLQKTDFYTDAFDAECSFFGTLPRSGETMADLAKRWEANLHAWRRENPGGLIIATLGMAADGHTAGIFPFDDEKKFNQLFKGEPWVVAYNVGNASPYQERVTTTLSFLKLIDLGFAFVVGGEKKAKLDTLIQKHGEIHALPALAWHDIKKLKIFTDIRD